MLGRGWDWFMAVPMDWLSVLDAANGVIWYDTGSVKERSVGEN